MALGSKCVLVLVIITLIARQCHSSGFGRHYRDFKLHKMHFAYDLKEILRHIRGLRFFMQPIYTYGTGPLYPLPYREPYRPIRNNYDNNYREPYREMQQVYY